MCIGPKGTFKSMEPAFEQRGLYLYLYILGMQLLYSSTIQ